LGTVAIAIGTDLAMAAAKAVAAALTGSAALFAETLHSLADTGNQLLLLKGLRGSRRRPDISHPFGYGAELFYWSLLAALGIFVVGGVLSIWEGAQRLLHPSEVQMGLVGFAVLGLGFLLDGTSWLASVRQLRREATARGVPFRQHLRSTPTPQSRPSSTRTRRRCSATRSPSPGSGCTSSSAPRRPTLLPGS
jgi:cation diffusion facilitator family transporter